MQALHLIHMLLSIVAGCFFSQVIALLGHALKHSPHILQFYGFTSKRIKFLQTNAEQCFSLMWASYSWRK